MAPSVLTREHLIDQIAPARWPSQRRWWMVGLALFALSAGLFGYLAGNEVQVNTQFDQAHASLDTAQHRFSVTLSNLATVRRDLHVIDGGIADDTTALTDDSSEIKGLQAALDQAQAMVSSQGVAIGDLQTCLGGVQKAVNALSVGDQNDGISALDAVSGPCQSAAASSG
jgi:hypothetical protein